MENDKELNQLKPLIQYSAQFQKHKPVFAFYLKTYACERTHQIYKQYKAQGQDVELFENSLKQWFADCDAIKAQNPQLFNNKQQAQQDMTEYTLKLFLKSDNEEREDTFSLETVKNFKLAASLILALNVFGPISPDMEKKRKYALLHAVKVHKKLKDPNYVRKPAAQNQLDNEFAQLEQQFQQQNNLQNNNNQQNNNINPLSVNDESNVGNIGFDGSHQKAPAYISNFNNNRNPQANNQYQQPQQQQPQYPQQNQPQNNYPQQQQPNQQQGFQSVFNNVPQVINNQQVQNQNSINQIINQQQQQQQQQQQINIPQQPQPYQQPQQTLNVQQPQQDLKSRFQTKSGQSTAIVKGQVVKNCQHAINSLDSMNIQDAKKQLNESLKLLQELI